MIIGSTDNIISDELAKKINSQITEILCSHNLTIYQAVYVLQLVASNIEESSNTLPLSNCAVNL